MPFAQFGTADKPILLATVTLVTLVAAAVAGALSRRRVWLGIGFIVPLTGLAPRAAVTRPSQPPRMPSPAPSRRSSASRSCLACAGL